LIYSFLTTFHFNGRDCVRREIHRGTLNKDIILRTTVIPENAEAEFSNDLLIIKLPKVDVIKGHKLKNICKDCEQKLIEMYNRIRRSDRNSNSDSIEDIIEELANRASSGKKQIEQLIKDEG
jgi:HSP20 family molecular chaperone IbpA